MVPNGAYPVFGANGIIGRYDKFNHLESQLVIGCRGACGAVHVTPPYSWITGNTMVVQAKTAEIDINFLRYFFLGPAGLANATTGTAQPQLTQASLKKIRVSLPIISEQKRIVALLDQAFTALDRVRDQVEANLHDAKAIFARLLDQFFPSISERETKPLFEFIDIEHGYAFKSQDFETSEDSALPIVLTPGNFNETGELYFRNGKTKRLKCEPPEGFTFEKGELTVVMTDLSPKMNILGKPAFITHDNLLHNQRIGRVRFLNDKIEPRFIYYFFRARSFSDNLKSTATGTMVRHTAPKRILNCEVPEYTRHEQVDIISQLDRAQSECLKLQHNYEKKAEEVSHLRKSLLAKAFTGELG